MSDPTQFMVSYSLLHRLLQHQGIIGANRDQTGLPYSLHSYSDPYGGSYHLQLFEALESETLSSRLSALAKMAHSSFVPNLVRPALMATRKTGKTAYELAVLYDCSKLGSLTLQKILAEKRKEGQKFETEQITAFFWQIADLLHLGTRGQGEYLQIFPSRFLCRLDGQDGYNFFLMNCAAASKQDGFYIDPADQWHRGSRTNEAAQSSAMFSWGMILLEMASLLPSHSLYQQGQLNRKSLSKRIEGVKITNDRMICAAIRLLLEEQSKRMRPADIFKNEEWLKLRRVAYSPSRNDFFTYKNFEGIVQYDKGTAIGEALDNDLCMLRGTFTKGVLQGRGVRQVGDSLQLGTFANGQLKQGQALRKNSYAQLGQFKGGQLQSGIRLPLNISSKEGKNSMAQRGQFKEGQLVVGVQIFADGRQETVG